MRAQVCIAALSTAVLVPVLWALPVPAPAPAPQKGGGGGITGPGSVESSVMATEGARAMTPFEQFADKLNLDEKTQVPQASQIFKAAADEAAPVAVQMLQLRQALLNADLQSADVKSVLDQYTGAAAKMSRIEADSFAKVYALLKPNQQSKAAQAFVLMAGFFQSGPVSSRGRRGEQP